MLIKDDIWKYERPIYSKKIYLTSDGHINFKYLNAVNDGKNTNKKINEFLNCSKAGSNTRLVSMVSADLLKRSKNNGKYNYVLSKRGKYLYNCLLKYQ